MDSPEEGADPHFDNYFYNKIQVADSIIDNNAEKMGKIRAIIEKAGIDVTTPKAYFDYVATSVKRRDGSYVANATATNRSNVAADHGQFRVYFAPDVRLLREPKGAAKDSTTTLESARTIHFDSIAANGTARINLEFVPIRESFPADVKFFVVDFGCQCETCGNDNYSHALKFTLSAFDVKQ